MTQMNGQLHFATATKPSSLPPQHPRPSLKRRRSSDTTIPSQTELAEQEDGDLALALQLHEEEKSRLTSMSAERTEEIFNIAYFGSAKAVCEAGVEGFGSRKNSHSLDLPKNTLFFYEEWNKGNHEALIMRGVVVFDYDFLTCCSQRYPLYHAMESCTTALLGGYNPVVSRAASKWKRCSSAHSTRTSS
jgi:hypothetical protein